jgi:F420-dependent oxidoreductase-like protein
MRFGLMTTLTGATWNGVSALWQHVEATGWDVACVTDHFMPNLPDPVGDTLECWTTLSGLAGLTRRMRIGTLVSGNTYRHPAVLAKMAANLDIMSGGRLICGLGAGWQENEHAAYGIPFYTLAERLERLDEACRVLKGLWTQAKTSFEGRHYRLTAAPLFPKPVQQPHPELLIGGGGEKVTLGIVARHADLWNVWGGPGVLARKGKILEAHCVAGGRDPRAIVRSANMPLLFTDSKAEGERLVEAVARRLGWHVQDPQDTVLAGSVGEITDRVGRLKDAGVGLLFIPTIFLSTPFGPTLDRFIDEVAPAFRP